MQLVIFNDAMSVPIVAGPEYPIESINVQLMKENEPYIMWRIATPASFR